MQRELDPSTMPPHIQAMLARPAPPLIVDTWECPKGHQVKVDHGGEPRLMLGPGAVTPKPVCLTCWLGWMSEMFPISKKAEPQQEEPSSLIVPG